MFLQETVSRVAQPVVPSPSVRPEATRVASLGRASEPLALIGEDPAFMAVKQKIPRIADYDAPVLITGETGTGKEIVARALHRASRRAARRFVPVNVGAIPTELFESELFGYERGAFTGAAAAKQGLVGEAGAGTLFLDEVETLSLSGQVKLLRFLQDLTYYVLGSPRMRHADVWIIAATNTDLTRRICEGSFRADLFYRLAVVSVTLPSLRERRADIALLTDYFWGLYAGHRGPQRPRWSLGAMRALCDYAWPGNIRELENVVRHVALFGNEEVIELDDLPELIRPLTPRDTSFRQAKLQVIQQFERTYLSEALRVHRGNITRAAREARVDRRAFGRLIKKYQIAKR